MNKQMNFSGTINGRTYSDEKVYLMALREAILKGQNVTASATSTACPVPVEAPKPIQCDCEDEFTIAIDPRKIAANLECAEDKEEFLDNLEQGLEAVLESFTEALDEGKINPAKATEALSNEIVSVRSQLGSVNSSAGYYKNELARKKALYQKLAEELKTTENLYELKTDTSLAYNMLVNTYDSMLTEINNRKRNTRCECSEPKVTVKEQVASERVGGPTPLEQLITDFVNMWK